MTGLVLLPNQTSNGEYMPISSHTITIQNRLEILPGDVITVPGCEPVSAFTSPTLAANRECNGTIIPLATAKEVIPGYSIVTMKNWGHQLGTRRFFVLPSGPPPSPNKCNVGARQCVVDWYQILRDNAEPLPDNCGDDAPQTVDQMCDAFSLNTRCGIF